MTCLGSDIEWAKAQKRAAEMSEAIKHARARLESGCSEHETVAFIGFLTREVDRLKDQMRAVLALAPAN